MESSAEQDSGSARAIVRISEDRMQATLEVAGPAAGEPPVTAEEISAAIAAAGIVHGLSREQVAAAWKLLDSEGALPEPVPIASGTPPVPWKEATTDYCVELQRSVGEIVEGSDHVDFHEQNLVINVERGERLGSWCPGQEAVMGHGVDGSEVGSPEGGKAQALRVGQNIIAEEQADGSMVLLSEMHGMLAFADDGTPTVTDLLELSGDVGVSTGNVCANGNVVISGSVSAGFHVEASGDIHVRGTVAGADLRAGGSIVLDAGLIGEEESKVVAQGNVTLKYSQNAHVIAGGDVEILDSDTASKIECSGNITASGGKGRLQGGTYVAGGNITARELGSELGAPTFAFAGRDPLGEAEFQRLRNALKELNAKARKLQRTSYARAKGRGSGKKGPKTLDKSPTKSKAVMETMRRRKQIIGQLTALQERMLDGSERVIIAQVKACIGLTVAIGKQTTCLDESRRGCRFAIDHETTSLTIQAL